ncbi:MAG: SDR family oxidoreductase [Phycisphaerae bacterium]|nr:SDR family oxidoreductase [Gemmatimonadaceae bacterium]
MAPAGTATKHPKNPLPAQHQPRPGDESKITPRPRFEAPGYKGSEKLLNKNALITGGDSGIGRAVAVLFAREGANVAITYLAAERNDAETTAEAVMNEGRECLLLEGDLTDYGFCKAIVQETVDTFGSLDVLVNNAAFQKHQKNIASISDEQFAHTFDTNIGSYFRVARAALEVMPDGGAIVNTGSITGLEGSKELIDYASTKGAIHAFTKSLAQSLVERNIRVNCVSPGPVWTPLNVADKDAEEVAKHGAETPMKRPAQPEEVAPAFVFFASDACSSYITGEVLTLLGGETTAA